MRNIPLNLDLDINHFIPGHSKIGVYVTLVSSTLQSAPCHHEGDAVFVDHEITVTGGCPVSYQFYPSGVQSCHQLRGEVIYASAHGFHGTNF